MRQADPRFIRTQQALRAALFVLLKTQAVGDITVTALCKQAQINRRTFYLHYDNVWALFTEYEAELGRQLGHVLAGAAASPETLVGTFNRIFEANLAGFTYICRYRRQDVLLLDMAKMLTTALLTRSPQPSARQRMRAQYVANGVIALYVEWLNTPQAPPFAELSDVVLEMVRRDWGMLNG